MNQKKILSIVFESKCCLIITAVLFTQVVHAMHASNTVSNLNLINFSIKEQPLSPPLNSVKLSSMSSLVDQLFVFNDGSENKKEDIRYIEIAFGEKIQLPELTNSVTWTITGPSGTSFGSGTALNDHVFDKPGKYEISLADNSASSIIHEKEESCAHEKFPSKINITVFPIKMIFLGDELQLSAELQKGIETTGITISIPVIIETYGNQELTFNTHQITTAGIGTTIVASLKKGTILKEGKQTLEYELSGIAENEAYIMFDFLDINGKVQGVALKTLIK